MTQSFVAVVHRVSWFYNLFGYIILVLVFGARIQSRRWSQLNHLWQMRLDSSNGNTCIEWIENVETKNQNTLEQHFADLLWDKQPETFRIDRLYLHTVHVYKYMYKCMCANPHHVYVYALLQRRSIEDLMAGKFQTHSQGLWMALERLPPVLDTPQAETKHIFFWGGWTMRGYIKPKFNNLVGSTGWQTHWDIHKNMYLESYCICFMYCI